MAYLDHAATTPPFPEVVERVSEVMGLGLGNPSGMHRAARRAASILEEARSELASLVGTSENGVIFTSGGTESDNLAVRGLGSGPALVSSVEHRAVLEPAALRAAKRIPVTETGTVDSTAARDMLCGPDARGGADSDRCAGLVSVMTVNNETGVVQPVRKISDAVRQVNRDVVVHSDAAQAFHVTDVQLDRLGVDAISISGHKFGGPQGVGALVMREGLEVRPSLLGGGQELGRRAGTPSVALIAGLATAARLAADARETFSNHASELAGAFLASIAKVRDWDLNGAEARRSPHILNLRFEGVLAEDLLVLLDSEGVSISSGASCSSGATRPSHVLEAAGLSVAEARGSIRISFGWSTTFDDVEIGAKVLGEAVARLRERTGRS